MNKKYLLFEALVLLLILWTGISFVRTVHNLSKLATEERSWYFLSDEQKRQRQFGDLHSFFRFVQKHTKEGSIILFFTEDGKPYYLGRYYLYPTKVIWGEYQYVYWDIPKKPYDYVLIYDDSKIRRTKDFTEYIKGHKLIAQYKRSQKEKGYIYKK